MTHWKALNLHAPQAWETTACDGCGGVDERLVFEGPDRLMQRPGVFRLVQCPRCGLIRQNPRLAWPVLKDYYEGDYVSYAPQLRDVASAWRRLDRRYGLWKQRRVVERAQPGGHLLDVGCGTGVFLEEMLRTGRWTVMGVEPTPSAAAYTRERLGIEVAEGRFSDVSLPEGAFDAVTLWNVLEHVPSPAADLRRAHRLLRPDGRLVFTVPNVHSLEAHLFGRYWVGWDLPRHLFLFPRHTMRRMLAEAGFEVMFETCVSSTHASIRDSLEFWSQSWPAGARPHKRWLMALYKSLPVRLALGPPFWLLDRLRRSTILIYVARKRSPKKAADAAASR